jgi:F-type H+-transporting ATPase subunit epsilon
MNLQVCIMTPDEIFWNEQAEEIILPTNTGQMGVLTNHVLLLLLHWCYVNPYKDWTSVALWLCSS